MIKYLSWVCLALVAVSPIAHASQQTTNVSASTGTAEGSTGAITLQVSTTGSDSDAARPTRVLTGDWTAHPYLTLQAALNALPKLLRYSALINMGAGTFDGAIASGFKIDEASATTAFPLLKIAGSYAQITPATGTASGTATSGSQSNSLITLTDSGQSWTSSDLRGHLLLITAGTGSTATTNGIGTNYALYEIIDNAATAITFRSGLAGNFTPTSSTVYQIVDPSTYIRKYLGAAGTTAALTAQYCDGIIVQLLKLGGNSATAGLLVSDSGASYAYGLRMTDAMAVGVSYTNGTRLNVDAVYASGVTAPISASRFHSSLTVSDVVEDTGAGLNISDGFRVTINGFDIRNSTSTGILLTRTFFNTVTNGNIQSSTSSAIQLSDTRQNQLSIVAGSSNGSLGVDIVRTSYTTVTSPNVSGGVQVTGSSGDFRMDSNIQTWSTLSGMGSSGKLKNNDVTVSL